MVKFSKQFEAQLVPEWKEAFVDYLELKKDLKIFHLLNTTPTPPKEQEHHVSLVNTIFCLRRKFSPFRPKYRAIQVHKKLASSTSNGDMYETELLEQFADIEAAKEFFTCLDMQLSKVNQFYRMKEKEFVERGESMMKQLEILIELKTALNQKNGGGGSKEDASVSCTISSEQEQLQESSSNDELSHSDSSRTEEVEKSMNLKREDSRLKNISSHVFNIQGKNVRINVPLSTPTRTFSAISYLIWGDIVDQSTKKSDPETRKLHFNRKKVHQAEKMIREALIELYKGLSYLKTFRHLNMLAFIKILKKFDKVTGKEILPIYLKVVETSYFNSSDKVMNLLDEVEERFVKEFTEHDRRKAMKYLRPRQHKDSHSSFFFTGLFTGCFIALLAGYIIMAHATGMYRLQPDTVYMETVFPVLSIFGLLFLHLFLYGCNIFMWRKARINYIFILELAPTKELEYRDVFLICTTSMTAVIGVMFIHLSLISKAYSYHHIKAIPGFLLLMFLLLLICPSNAFYRSSRYRFLRVIKNIILSPLYKVVMLDFFMADQLCSQIPLLQNLEYVICYCLTGSYKTQDYQNCRTTGHYKDLAYAVSFLPYYWRAMQCARRWFDEGKISHLVNLGKYVSAMLAAGVKVAYEKNEKNAGWLFSLVVISTAATMYQLYWDFVRDWGLLQINSKNPWLRNKLMLRQKFIYYFSMVLNMVLRLAWLQTIVHSNFEHVDYRVTRLFLAALEVIRRGLWNFYRLENEHLHNAGKFRAVDNVPLPFHEVDEED